MKTLTGLVAGAFGLLIATASPGIAQDYPERPLELIVAYSAGGGTDITARTIAPFIESALGGSISVMNRPGAAGGVGFTALARAKADGYTIGFINIPDLLNGPIERDTAYEADDFMPIGRIVYDPGTIGVLESSEFQTLDDLIAYAKENPGTVTYASAGIGSVGHISMLEFEKLAGVELLHIPFSGASDVRTALLGEHVQLTTSKISELLDDVHEGKVRVLGQMSEERYPQLADVPTFKEAGFDLVMGSHRGIAAPVDTPEDIVAKLQDAVAAAVQDPGFVEKAQDQNLLLAYQNSSDFLSTIQTLDTTMKGIWEEQPWVEQ